MTDPVWVTGMGCICSAGADVASVVQGVASGCRPQSVPKFFADSDNGKPVCAVADNWLTSGWRSGSTNDSNVLLQKATQEALACASLAVIPAKTGICVGTTAGCALHVLEDYGTVKKNPGKSGTFREIDDFYKYSMAFSLAANLHQLMPEKISGPQLTISNACTSGADAIGMAAQWIQAGLCDIAIAGGTDALSIIPYIGFNKLMIYSPEPCLPFDKKRKGLNLGEGSGVLVLENAGHAKKRGAAPLATLEGYGSTSDAHHMTAPHPHGQGLRSAINNALHMSGARTSEIAFINAHGTATTENDKTESTVYADMFSSTPVWASKGVTGHCLGAAGAIEAILSIYALNKGVVPVSTGSTEPEDNIAGLITLREQPISGNLAMSVSLGFGGSNAALIFAGSEAAAR